MSEETNFRQRKPTNPLDTGFNDPTAIMERVKELEKVTKAVNPMTNKITGGEMPFEVKGNVPPQLANMFKKDAQPAPVQQSQPIQHQQPKEEETLPASPKVKVQNSKLDELREILKGQTAIYEEVTLPSLSKFYKHGEAPPGGVLNIRRMTGDEEEILGTQRFLKRGQAISMIFQNCVKEKVDPSKWLTIDRTFLLFYLRGISMGTNYDVGIRCPNCQTTFETTIDLDSLTIRTCPENYGIANLVGKLPNSGFSFEFRLPTVVDEQQITHYQERRRKQDIADDSMTFRLATLLEHVEGLNEHAPLMELLKELPIGDFAYLREVINDIPFGIDTKVDQFCPSCGEEFKTDLPIEANFFFPRRRKENRTRLSE